MPIDFFTQTNQFYSQNKKLIIFDGNRVIDSGEYCNLFYKEFGYLIERQSIEILLNYVKQHNCTQTTTGIGFYFFKTGDIFTSEKFLMISIYHQFRDIFATRLMSKIKATQLKLKSIDNYLKESWCNRPFEHLEVTDTGNSYLCCPHWLPRPVGDASTQEWQTIWNSNSANEIRESIIDGSFKFCNTFYCPYIASRSLQKRESTVQIQSARNSPNYIALSYDRTCNLSCPSCRTQIVVHKKTELSSFDKINRHIASALPLSDTIQITGSGDLFASNHYRRLVSEYTNSKQKIKRLHLITNAVLFDEKSWTQLKLKNNVKSVAISIDAATEKTYAVTRRGGDFNRLMKNLDFISELRKSGEIERLCFYFVVQTTNYKEMPHFVSMGIKYNVDEISFTRIRNWGTYDNASFANLDICNSNHPNHENLVEILKNPIFKNPTVNISI